MTKNSHSPEVLAEVPSRGQWLRRRSHAPTSSTKGGKKKENRRRSVLQRALSPSPRRPKTKKRTQRSKSLQETPQHRHRLAKSLDGHDRNESHVSKAHGATHQSATTNDIQHLHHLHKVFHDDEYELSSGGANIKIVAVGDAGVGKTSMLLRFQSGTFPSNYTPTICESFLSEVNVGEDTFKMTLWDTAGQEDYDRVRKLSYVGTDLFLVCYAVDSVYSLHRMVYRWLPEIRHHCPKTGIILVGLKADLRRETPRDEFKELSKTNSLSRVSEKSAEETSISFLDVSPSEATTIKGHVSRLEGKAVAKKIKALDFVECSALTADGVKTVVNLAARHAVEQKQLRGKRQQCIVS